MEQAQRLEPIDLLRIYGNIEFDWNLATDHIDWLGPLNRLISPEISLVTGSSFNNLLTPQNFIRRLEGLDQARQSKGNTYDCEYTLTLPNHETATVYEEGTLHYDHAGNPFSLSGFIRFIDINETHLALAPLDGYDAWTGFPTKEILFENLASLLEQSNQSKMPGAYLSLSVDCLTSMSCRFGCDVAFDLFKQVADKLRAAIRFNDSIGRTSSACLGIILQDCDRWGIVRASDRLSKCIEDTSFQTSAGPLKVKISSGGIVFPEQSLTAVNVMKKSEQYLFEAQAVRGSGVAWTPYGEGVQDLERPNKKAVTGKRRAVDSEFDT
jgi:diguanylate cyclase (GGDEF)-like protein